MGGKFTCQLNSKEQGYISERIAEIMANLAPLNQRHLCSNLLTHLREKHMEPAEPRPLIQHLGDITHAGIVLEGTLPQYLDGVWTHRHLQVSNTFTVESRDAKEVFEGGWGCKTEVILSGCQICTSTQQHRDLVRDMCRHIADKSDSKLACWDCPTAFPVFIQHPYGTPICLAASSCREQTRWANVLRVAAQRQSSALPADTPESKAFLDAVFSLRRVLGNGQAAAHPAGDEEEVMVSVVMEEVMEYLKEQVFPRIMVHQGNKKQTWIKLLSEVYRTAGQQVRTAMAGLREELSLYRSHVEKQMFAGLEEARLLHDHIANSIKENMFEPILQSLLLTVVPRLERTLQEVAAHICEGFAATRQYFLETCDTIIELGAQSSPVKDLQKDVLAPLANLGPSDDRMRQCLNRLELSRTGCVWLQDVWGVHSRTWIPLTLKAQNALYKVVDTCAVMFSRLVSRCPCSSSDFAQLMAVLCRVRDRVVKHFDTELLALRSRLIEEIILQITLPAFERSVGKQDLSRYYDMVNSEQATFIHPDIIFHSILRDNLKSYTQSVLRYSLPQQCVPLPVSSSTLCSSGSVFSEPVYHELLPPGACQQYLCQTSEGSASESATLEMNNSSDTLANSENLENNTPSLLDAGEYIYLAEP